MKKFITAFALGTLLLPSAALASDYTDVPADHWASNAIYELSGDGLIAGYPDGTYKPLSPITKGQAVTILKRQSDGGEEIGRSAFGEQYNPHAPLTRAEAAVLLAEEFNLPATSVSTQSFADAPADYWAHDAISAAAENGIIEGESATLFDPDGSISRAFFAVIVNRAMDFTIPVPQETTAPAPSAKESAPAAEAPVQQEATAVQPSEVQATIALVNEERAAKGAQAVTEDPELSKIAQAKAEDMAVNGYFDHNSPTYGTPFDMAYDFGYSYQMFGENLAMGQTTAEMVVTDWMNSDSHRDNLLKSGYTSIGVGYAEAKDGTPYWVHMFALK